MKKFLLLIYIIIFSFDAFSQNPLVKQWDYRFGGNYNEEFAYMNQTSDGGYILGGHSYSDSSGDKTQGNRDTILLTVDYWIVKINSVGIKQWDKRFGGEDNELFRSVKQTSDGGYILGGDSYSDSSGDKTQPGWGYADYWIVKTDSVGNKQWDKRFGGTGSEFFGALMQTPDGGYIIGGLSQSGISGDKTEPSWGAGDYWILKIDALGNKLWDKRYGGTGADRLLSMQQTVDGKFILGGRSSSDSSGDKTQFCWGSEDYWMIKIDTSGGKLWDKRFGGTDNEFGGFVLQTNDGGFAIAGFSDSDSSGDKTQNSQGWYDYWIVKTDSLGNKQWDKTFGGDDLETGWNVFQTLDNGFLLSGETRSNASGDKTEDNLGPDQTWIVKIDSVGTKQWDKTIFALGFDHHGFAIQANDGCYTTAEFTAAGISGYKSQPAWGQSDDYWIIKFCDSTLTTNLTPALSKEEGIVIAPNPANDFINISFTTAEKNLQVELYDLFGRKVFEKPFQNKINIQHLPQGIYILEIKGATVFYKTKLVKQ